MDKDVVANEDSASSTSTTRPRIFSEGSILALEKLSHPAAGRKHLSIEYRSASLSAYDSGHLTPPHDASASPPTALGLDAALSPQSLAKEQGSGSGLKRSSSWRRFKDTLKQTVSGIVSKPSPPATAPVSSGSGDDNPFEYDQVGEGRGAASPLEALERHAEEAFAAAKSGGGRPEASKPWDIEPKVPAAFPCIVVTPDNLGDKLGNNHSAGSGFEVLYAAEQSKSVPAPDPHGTGDKVQQPSAKVPLVRLHQESLDEAVLCRTLGDIPGDLASLQIKGPEAPSRKEQSPSRRRMSEASSGAFTKSSAAAFNRLTAPNFCPNDLQNRTVGAPLRRQSIQIVLKPASVATEPKGVANLTSKASKPSAQLLVAGVAGGGDDNRGGSPSPMMTRRSQSLKRPKQRPMIWEYFDMLPNSTTVARCRACKMNVSCKYNTGPFFRHLQLAHMDIYKNYQTKIQNEWTKSIVEKNTAAAVL